MFLDLGMPTTFILTLILSTIPPIHLQIFDHEDVTTSSGVLQGTITYHNGVPLRTYLGVPFAKPPLGELRFKKPLPVERSPLPIPANQNPPACIQYTTAPFPWRVNTTNLSEDCLYLNIWVPESGIKCHQKSVMFWIYGGGFTVGSIGIELYDARALAAEGDVIVVTTNYRLGALGFLTSGDPKLDAPGNQGLYDILEALKWTKTNIEAFGGDRNKITIFGESAGAFAVGYLSVSPLAKGFFQRAILESGSPAHLLGDNNAVWVNLGQNLAKAVGCANDTTTIENSTTTVVSCMKGLDALNITRVLNSFNPFASFTFLPVFGDELLPTNPKEAIIAGNFTNVDILCGANQDEGAFLLTTPYSDVLGFYGEKNPQINKTYGQELILNSLQIFPFKNEAVHHFLKNVGQYEYDKVRRQVYTSLGDIGVLCPTIYFAEKYAEKGNKVYFYFFTHRPSKSPWADWMGVAHFEEVQFVFGSPLKNSHLYKNSEIKLSRKIIQMWSNFAKYGHPTYYSFKWPLYSRDNPRFVFIKTNEKSVGLGPHKENCDFYRSYVGFQ